MMQLPEDNTEIKEMVNCYQYFWTWNKQIYKQNFEKNIIYSIMGAQGRNEVVKEFLRKTGGLNLLNFNQRLIGRRSAYHSAESLVCLWTL